MVKDLYNNYAQTFGRDPGLRVFFAPGRVNLIGEHIDYSGGHVFPCAIDYGTYLAVGKRKDKKLFGFSHNFFNQGIIKGDLEDTRFRPDRGWLNYALGIFETLKKQGYSLGPGFNFYIRGNIPAGAGLSSSASLEMAVACAANEIYGLNLQKLDLVNLCHTAENEYMRVNCGIMDQFAVAMGQEGSGLLLDCRDLTYDAIPLHLKDKSLVLINSKKERALVDSQYNQRRASCEKALEILQKYRPAKYLCDIGAEEFATLEGYLTDPEIRKRARHAIGENARALRGAEALKNGDWPGFGRLMQESHTSLQEDYEVSTRELDLLAALARDFPGTCGARMTGAGFGGCTVNIVETCKIEEFIRHVSAGYRAETGLQAEFYVARASQGAREICGD